MKILITGGNGKLANEIKKVKTTHDIIFADKDLLNLSYFTNTKGIETFCKDKYFDVIVGNANKYQGVKVEDGMFNLDGPEVTLGHSYLITKLEVKPKYYINFTTTLSMLDEYYFYRAVKTFNEDYLYRFFKSEYPNIKYFNIHPGHIDDEKNRISASKLLINFIDNIENFNLLNYNMDHDFNIINEHEGKTLSWK